MTLHVDNPDNLPEAEVAQYVARAEDLIARGELPADTCRLEISLHGDEVDIRYYRPTDLPLEHIARVTGYLTGTVARWNNAKQAEYRDRYRHFSRLDPHLSSTTNP